MKKTYRFNYDYFDKSRIFTPVNADELPVGSRCIFADTVQELQQLIQADTNTTSKLEAVVKTDKMLHRFLTTEGKLFILAYLVELPRRIDDGSSRGEGE